jgi:hypothetical protein
MVSPARLPSCGLSLRAATHLVSTLGLASTSGTLLLGLGLLAAPHMVPAIRPYWPGDPDMLDEDVKVNRYL